MPGLSDHNAEAAVPESRTVQAQRDDARARTDRMLFARRDRGERGARDALIERFLPLARSIARRYETSCGEPLEDLVQVASLGLVKAIDRYDPSRGVAFSSYAVPTIAGELKRYFRDRTWAVRPPRDLQELTLRVEAAASELTASADRAPTVAELAAALRAGEEDILEALQARRARAAVSLSSPIRLGDDRGSVLEDTLGSGEDGYACAEDRVALERLLRCVSPRVRLVLRLRFERDLTQAEIGELLGVSQMQVSRIIRSAISQLGDVADYEHERSSPRPPVAV
jgi:RNA polymerase sigma-B factor